MQKAYSTEMFNTLLDTVRSQVTLVKSNVQDLLITACFHAFAHRNTTPLNQILDLATNSKAISVERITRWVELHAKIARIKKEAFVLVDKVQKDSGVMDEATFAPYEADLRKMAWYDIMKKEVAKSAFDIEGFLESTLKQLDKHSKDADVTATPEMFEMARIAIKQAKGKIALASIEQPAPATV